MTKKKPVSEHKTKGRPQTRVSKLNASPERAARAFFSDVKQPDPSRRKTKRKVSA